MGKKKAVVFMGSAVVLAALALGLGYRLLGQREPSEQLVIVTWNVRGYPEKEADRREWFTAQLVKIRPRFARRFSEVACRGSYAGGPRPGDADAA